MPATTDPIDPAGVARASVRARRRSWARTRWRLRRAVLARRRWLAAVLAALAVLAAVRAAAPPPEPAVAVLVAAHDLPAGTVLGAADLERVRLPRGSPPDGVAADPVGATLASPLRRGEPVTDVRLVGPGLVDLEPGSAAVPVRLPDAGMADLLAVGDRVDVLATDPASGEAATIAPGALVLALPGGEPAAASVGSTGLAGRLVVLGVPRASVTRLSAAGATMFLTVAFSR